MAKKLNTVGFKKTGMKEMGCRISENLSADDFTADVPQEELENAIDGAEGFLEQHCN